jgi:hypothetical protein
MCVSIGSIAASPDTTAVSAARRAAADADRPAAARSAIAATAGNQFRWFMRVQCKGDTQVKLVASAGGPLKPTRNEVSPIRTE